MPETILYTKCNASGRASDRFLLSNINRDNKLLFCSVFLSIYSQKKKNEILFDLSELEFTMHDFAFIFFDEWV